MSAPRHFLGDPRDEGSRLESAISPQCLLVCCGRVSHTQTPTSVHTTNTHTCVSHTHTRMFFAEICRNTHITRVFTHAPHPRVFSQGYATTHTHTRTHHTRVPLMIRAGALPSPLQIGGPNYGAERYGVDVICI